MGFGKCRVVSFLIRHVLFLESAFSSRKLMSSVYWLMHTCIIRKNSIASHTKRYNFVRHFWKRLEKATVVIRAKMSKKVFRDSTKVTLYVLVLLDTTVPLFLFLSYRVACFHTMILISIDWEPTTFSCLSTVLTKPESVTIRGMDLRPLTIKVSYVNALILASFGQLPLAWLTRGMSWVQLRPDQPSGSLIKPGEGAALLTKSANG